MENCIKCTIIKNTQHTCSAAVAGVELQFTVQSTHRSIIKREQKKDWKNLVELKRQMNIQQKEKLVANTLKK